MSKTKFFFICFGGIILSFNVAATSALIPSISVSLGKGPLIVGEMIWLYMIPYGIFALVYVPLTYLINIKVVLEGSLFLFSLANLSVGFSHSLAQIFISRIFMGVFGASIVPLTFFIVSNSADREKRGRILGTFFSLTFISSLAGLFLSGIMNWRYIYIIPGVTGIILVIHEMFYLNLDDVHIHRRNTGLNYVNALKDKRVYSIFLYIFIASVLYHSTRQWMGVYFYEGFSFSQFLISSLLLVLSAVGILGELGGGIMSDKNGRVKTINLGVVLMAVSLILIALPGMIPLEFTRRWTQVIYFAAALAIFGTGWTFNHIGLSTMITDLPDDLVSYASGLNSSVRFLAGGIGALIGGAVIKNYGFVVLFSIGAIGLLVLYLLKGILKTGRQAYAKE